MLHALGLTREGRGASVWLLVIALLPILFPAVAAAAVPAEVEVILETRKVDTNGRGLNRYSVTDTSGNGYAVNLRYPRGKLKIERLDAWKPRRLATGPRMRGGMALGQWYTLALKIEGGQLTAEAYVGQVDPAATEPAVAVTATDSTYTPSMQVGVHGGYVYDTDNVRVFENGELVFVDDFDDGDVSDWDQFRLGLVDVQADGAGGYCLRKSGFNDRNGGIRKLPLATAPAEFDATLVTRKVNDAGGQHNRYSVTDAAGNGYGLYLNYGDSRLTIERRDAWVATRLATSAGALDPAMDLGEWFTLRLYRRGDQLTAEAYRGRVDPEIAVPEISVSASDADHGQLALLGVHGGADFDTDDVRVMAKGQLVLQDDFDDGTKWEWQTFGSGWIDLEADGAGFVLRKSRFDDPNGGIVGLAPPLIDVSLATLKVDTSGNAWNRYSVTDAAGNGYGVYLSYPDGNISIERRDEWADTALATGSDVLPGGMALNRWYSLSLRLKDGKLTAEADDPESPDPPIKVTASDSTYSDFAQFGINGGQAFLTDDVRVLIDGEVVLEDDFNDGDITNWEIFRNGQIELVELVPGDFAVRKFANDDPDGGLAGLIPGLTVLTFDPTRDGVVRIDDYETEYGVKFFGAALSSGAAFPRDGNGIENAAALVVVEFEEPVSRIDLNWVRLYNDIDFVATAKDAGGNIQYYVLNEACPFLVCSGTPLSGTEVITGEGIVQLEFEGTPPGGSTHNRSDPIVGLDALIFAP